MLKRQTIMMAFAVAIAATSAPAGAASVVVDFEDLQGTGVLADGYGGIQWNGNFSYYDQATPPFEARSGTVAGFPNYANLPPATVGELGFDFLAPVMFESIWFAGRNAPLTLSFFRGGTLLGSRSALAPDTGPMRADGWNAPIDRVTITGRSGFWVMDDVSYNTSIVTSAVPEPATWALMVMGFGIVGGAMRSARRNPNVGIRYARTCRAARGTSLAVRLAAFR